MRDFNNNIFSDTFNKIEDSRNNMLFVTLDESDFKKFKYFLTNKDYYAVIIDDYEFEITDKSSLIDALYFQGRLITMHNPNWDALHEGLTDLLNNLQGFEGACFLFKNSNLKVFLENEFASLLQIIDCINESYQGKRIKIIIRE